VTVSSGSFELTSGATLSDLNPGDFDEFDIRPVTGLSSDPSPHSATITVSNGNGVTASFVAHFTVNPIIIGNAVIEVTAPLADVIPDSTVNGVGPFSGVVSWGSIPSFASGITPFTATVTLTASNSDHTFTGGLGGTVTINGTPIPASNISIAADGATATLTRALHLPLREQLAWLQTNAVSGVSYTLVASDDDSLSPAQASLPSVNNVSVTIRGDVQERIIRLSAQGNLFHVPNGVTLTLGENITLMGRGPNAIPATANNNNALVRVSNGGTLIMQNGSRITGNTNTSATTQGGGG